MDLLQFIDGGHQAALLFLGQLVGDQVLPVEGAPCGFPADHRAHASHGLVQGIRYRQIPFTGLGGVV